MNWDSLPRNWHAEIACATLNEDICKDGRDPTAGRYFPRLNEEYPLESYHPGECGKYTAVEFVGCAMMLAYLAALFASCIAVRACATACLCCIAACFARMSETRRSMTPFIPKYPTRVGSVGMKKFRMNNEKQTRIEYLNSHDIPSLFNRLVTALIKNRPEDPVGYLVETLESGRIDDKFEPKSVAGIKL